MAAKKFLKPVSIAIAALLANTVTSGKANALTQQAADKAASNAEHESTEGRPCPDQITLEPSEGDLKQLDHYSHSSHASHASHRSHYSSYQ